MLLLTRRPGETVMIGNEVTVTIMGIKGNQVRVGVSAPREMLVDREEIRQRRDHDAAVLTKSAPRAPDGEA